MKSREICVEIEESNERFIPLGLRVTGFKGENKISLILYL